MEYLGLWRDRFGIPVEMFDAYVLFASSKTVYLVRRSSGLEAVMSMPVQMAGLPFVRHVGRYIKPVTCAVQRFGGYATRNVLDLDGETLFLLCRDGEIEVEKRFTPGYLVIRSGDAVWGASLFLEPDRVLCRLPKNMRRAVADGMVVCGKSSDSMEACC
jgi:hypothetical protein